MKRFFLVCFFAYFFSFSHQGFAAVQVFGPDFARFQVDVPDGWAATPNDGGCQISSPDQGSSISIQVHKANGNTIDVFADAIAKNIQGKIVKVEKESDTQTVIHAEVDGVRIAIICMLAEDKFLTVTMAGSDEEKLKAIINSLDEAK